MDSGRATLLSDLDEFRKAMEFSLSEKEEKLRKLSLEYDEELYPHLVSTIAERR